MPVTQRRGRADVAAQAPAVHAVAEPAEHAAQGARSTRRRPAGRAGRGRGARRPAAGWARAAGRPGRGRSRPSPVRARSGRGGVPGRRPAVVPHRPPPVERLVRTCTKMGPGSHVVVTQRGHMLPKCVLRHRGRLRSGVYGGSAGAPGPACRDAACHRTRVRRRQRGDAERDRGDTAGAHRARGQQDRRPRRAGALHRLRRPRRRPDRRPRARPGRLAPQLGPARAAAAAARPRAGDRPARLRPQRARRTTGVGAGQRRGARPVPGRGRRRRRPCWWATRWAG